MNLDDFITPIFDRTYEDVQTVKILLSKGYDNFTAEEKELWDTDLKGALNASDLNRIETNIAILLSEFGLKSNYKTWTQSDIPKLEDFERIRLNLLKLCKVIIPSFLVGVPPLPYNNYQKINEVEELIWNMFQISKNKNNYYCKEQDTFELYCGELIGLD